MGKINIGRVVIGGVVARIVMDLLGYLVDGLMLAEKWSDDMILLGKSEFSTTQLIEFRGSTGVYPRTSGGAILNCGAFLGGSRRSMTKRGE